MIAALLAVAALLSGDQLIGRIVVKYSGEPVTWTACADPDVPGDYSEYEILELVTNQVIAQGTEPLANDRFTVDMTLPRVGLYGGRIRACFNGMTPPDDRCSEWVDSRNANLAEVNACSPNGSNLVYSILAPPGAPEF